MSALVSIIIPVYNLEDYIENCLNSIVAQTYVNLEIICVDDGSTDASAEKINAMAEKDSRIKYIRQENAGVSAARNRGLDEATGDYIMFVDGDDYLHFQAVEILYNELNKNDCYCAICDFQYIHSFSEVQSDTVDNYESCCDLFENQMRKHADFHLLSGLVWARLIKADCAKSISFNTDLSRGEDSLYMSRLFLSNLNDMTVYVKHPLYYYYCRTNSASTKLITVADINSIYAGERILNLMLSTENDYLISLGYLTLFATIKRIQTDSIKTPLEKQARSVTKGLGKKYIWGIIKQKEITLKTRLEIFFSFIFSFRYSLLYKVIRTIIDPTMFDYYFKRKKT